MPETDTYFNLGNWRREIQTTSPAAQTWFNRGLNWIFGFNHEEAIYCFEQALNEDPECAMAQWGIAFAIGPNYNKIWEMFQPPERMHCLNTAHKAITDGLTHASSEVEKALLEALIARFPSDPETEEFAPYNDAFVAAMRPIYKAHQEDLDIASLFAEALMGRTPWQLWDLENRVPAEGASTVEARQVLEQAFTTIPAAWQHPGLLHMYVHLMEMSPFPELALSHGDHLATLVPDSGHLVHMATHIDVLCGEYPNVISRNHQAAIVDRGFTTLRGPNNFYTVYRIHNVHFEAYGAMFLAQKETALTAANALRQELLPEPVVAFLPDLFEAFWGMRLHVMVRFGMWQEIVDEPFQEDRELFCFTTALQRYTRVVALANLGRQEEASNELALFFEANAAVPKTRFMFNNPALEVLKIAAEMAQGELHYKAGEVGKGLDHLRQATYLSDHLLYDEPWGWMQPPRHALAALLMDQERYDEAEEIYRADLGLNDSLPRPCQHPGNVWSLHGLHECLTRRGETAEVVHIKRQLDRVIARADVKVGSSCYCRSAA